MIGNVEFDPLGFAELYDVKWLREAELKHGRVSMLAVVGWLVTQAGIHLPSPDGIYDSSNPIDAFFKVCVSVFGVIVFGVIVFVSIVFVSIVFVCGCVFLVCVYVCFCV